jgi:hypothetical protein
LKTFSEKYEAFIKITRLFEDIFREKEAFIRLFQRLPGVLKTFSMECKAFSKKSRFFKLCTDKWRFVQYSRTF